MRVLGTKTALKLLKVLFDNVLGEFKEIDLIKIAKTGKGSASQIINDLLKKNVLSERRAGKTKIISLNLRNRLVYLLKMIFDNEKLIQMEKSKLAALLLFTDKVKNYSKLIIAFGSSVAGTATKKSDIDVLIVSKNSDDLNLERKKIEELFGERLNLHYYSEEDVRNKINNDELLKNAFINGIVIYGYDIGRELFYNLKGKVELDRLLFLYDRVKSSCRNYLRKDYGASKDILNSTMEQLIFYVLSYKGIGYTSKKDAEKLIMELPEGKEISKIKKAGLKEKVNLSEKLILDIIIKNILEGEGYVK